MPSFTSGVQHDAHRQAQLELSHIDGTCPDLTLLFSREMTNHLRGAAPLAPATKSNRYQGQWKWRRAKDMSTATMMFIEG